MSLCPWLRGVCVVVVCVLLMCPVPLYGNYFVVQRLVAVAVGDFLCLHCNTTTWKDAHGCCCPVPDR